MKSKFDALRGGVLLGLVLPMLSIVIFYLIKYDTLSFMEFVDQLIVRDIYTQLISLCVVPNLGLFFIFIWKNFLYSGRGVILATFIYAFLIVILKFFT